MNRKTALLVQLGMMAALIAGAFLYPHELTALLTARPRIYLHAKFLHVLTATLFFGNVVIGTLWEARSLVARRLDVIRHTYETVAWLDAFFTAPLILIAVLTGVTLGTFLGGVFSMGWLTLAFGLFILSGVAWIAVDIPTQARVRRIFSELAPATHDVPRELLRVLRLRLWLNLLAIVPLLIVLYLMVQKPDLSVFHR